LIDVEIDTATSTSQTMLVEGWFDK